MQTYPMTPGQDIIFVQQKFSYNKAISNINMMMVFEFEVDEQLMKQALVLAIQRNQSASMRLCKENKQPRQYFSDQLPENITLEDLSNLSPEMAEETIERWGQKKFPKGSFDTQLYRAKLVRLPSQELAVYFCVSHLIFDAFALITMAGDMIGIYRALKQQRPLPKASPSPLPVYQKQWDYLESPLLQEDIAFFEDLYSEEMEYHSLNGRGSSEYVDGKRYGTTIRLWQLKAGFIDLRIPAKLVRGVEQLAERFQVPVQTFYMLALRNFMSKLDRSENITINHTVARRGTLAQKRAGGTMVNSCLFQMRQTNDMSLEAALNSMATYQMKLYRHTEIPYNEILKIIERKFKPPHMKGYSSIGLTFQPYAVSQYPDMPIRLKRYNNGHTAMPIYITIMQVDATGDLLCNYEYTKGFIKEESIHRFHRYQLAMLEKIIDQPELTLQDLVDLPIPEPAS